MGWVVWLIIAGCLFIAEMLTLTFYLLWLGLGAVAGAFAALLVPGSLILQVLVAAIVVGLLIACSKSIVKRWRQGTGYKDTIEMIVGKTGIVLQEVSSEVNGIVKIGGDAWSATADELILEGEKVRVIERRSTILYIRRERD